jgi:hypothetical protein
VGYPSSGIAKCCATSNVRAARNTIDWDPRRHYRTLFCGDHAAMERFLVGGLHTCAWNQQQDAGRPWAEAVAA